MLTSVTVRLWHALDRLADALMDRGADRAANMAMWATYGVIAKSSQDVHYDMGEAVIWSAHRAARSAIRSHGGASHDDGKTRGLFIG